MLDLAAIEQASAEAAGRRMAELIAADVHQVMTMDTGYAVVLARLAVGAVASFEAGAVAALDAVLTGVPAGSTRHG